MGTELIDPRGSVRKIVVNENLRGGVTFGEGPLTLGLSGQQVCVDERDEVHLRVTAKLAEHVVTTLEHAAMRRVAEGEMVEWSTTTRPCRATDATPRSPVRTASTSGVSGTQMKMTSAPSAAAAGVADHVAPLLVSAFALDFVRVCTFSGWPADNR